MLASQLTLSIKQALARAAELAQQSDSPDLDTALILSHVLGKDRTYFYAWPETALTLDQQLAFESAMARRLLGEPVAYILGYREFWSLNLFVSSATLIPRPDTETLVERALEYIPTTASRVLDMGTGTGAIALAIASERPACSVVACDFSDDALDVAKLNKQSLGLDNVSYLRSAWFDNVAGQFSVIVSNPPYIDEDDSHLSEGDVRFEPRSALVAADAGLADIRTIIDQAPEYLLPGGWLLLEHGWQQGESVRSILAEAGFSNVRTLKDLSGCERVTETQWNPGLQQGFIEQGSSDAD